MANTDKVVTKQLALTDIVNGNRFTGTDFGFDDNHRILYLKLLNLSAGTVSIKIGSTDAWILLSLTNPFELPYPLKFTEFWLKPSAPATIDAIAGLYTTA